MPPAVYLVAFAGDEPGPRDRLGAMDGVRVVRDLPPRRVVVVIDPARRVTALAEISGLDGVVSVRPDRLEQPQRGGRAPDQGVPGRSPDRGGDRSPPPRIGRPNA